MKKAFVLGGTAPHIELIRKLKTREYYTILVDYTDNPPAALYADLHLKASTLDKDEVLALAKEHNIDLIISTCIDQANSTACFVAEQLDLPHPYSYALSLDVTRKGLMKTIFKEHDIPTSDFYIVEKDDVKVNKLDFPLVIKPTDANSSKGVFKIDNLSDYIEKIDVSLSISREGKAIAEIFVPGTEIQVDCIVVSGVAHVLMTRDKVTMDNGGKELQVSGFAIPGAICESNKSELEEIAQKIVSAFHLDNTPFFYQAICNSEGVHVLEFAPRIAGGTTFDMVKKYTGFDYIEAAVKSFLNEPIELKYNKCYEKYITRFLYMKPGKFVSVDGVDSLRDSGLIDEYFPFVKSGKIITDSFNSGNRIGAVMAKGDSYDAATRRIEEALSKIKIIGEHQTDMRL